MSSLKTKCLPLIIVLSILSFSAITFVPAAVGAPATFTVNVNTDEGDANVGDGICEVTISIGDCTLRASIEEANATVDADTIQFTITGGGVQTITPASDLPSISEALTIDGYTNNPDASANTIAAPNPMNGTITIHIDGSGTTGIVFNITSADVTIKGLSVNRCETACIKTNEDNGTFQGNYVGVDPTGLSDGVSNSDIAISVLQDADNILIGGTNPADRNVFNSEGPDNTTTVSLAIVGTNVSVYGNIVGLGKDGVTDLSPEAVDVNETYGPFVKGIQTLGLGPVTVGGTSAGMTNIFSGNMNNISIGGVDGTFQGNLVGTDYTGEVNPNITNGIGVTATAQANGNLLGGVNAGEGNIIAGIGAMGVGTLAITITEWNLTLNPTRLAILGNSIYDVSVLNFEGIGDSNLGIDHAGYIDSTSPTPDFLPESFQNRGPTLNDVGDSDSGPNNFINFPVLNTSVQTGTDLEITYDLDVTGSDNNQYRVEFFANERASIFGYGPGQTYLGSHTTSNGLGKTVTLDVGSEDYSNMSLSANVTALDSTSPTTFGDTSEFALNILIGSAADFDADTISDAIEDAAPNGGDANDDGTPDSDQSTVSSFVSATSGDYTTFVTDICYSNGFVDSLSIDEIADTDSGFAYPYGLTDFVLNCPLGDTITIDKYIFTPETNTTDLSVRKYRPDTHTFENVTGIVVSENIGGEHALHLSYDITDGGALDDDGEANGVIVDPVGMAKILASSDSRVRFEEPTPSAQGTLSATGTESSYLMNLAFAILLCGLAIALMAKFSFKKSKA